MFNHKRHIDSSSHDDDKKDHDDDNSTRVSYTSITETSSYLRIPINIQQAFLADFNAMEYNDILNYVFHKYSGSTSTTRHHSQFSSTSFNTGKLVF